MNESSVDVEPIGSADGRRRIRVSGTVVRWLTQPTDALPRFEIVIADDTGRATVVWSGRRHIGGIRLGGALIVEGVPVPTDRGPRFVNPEYELAPSH